MKKLLPLLICVMLLLCSCAKLSPTLNVSLLDGDTTKSTKQLVKAVDDEKYPVKVRITYEENSVKRVCESTDYTVIMSVYDALSKVEINKQTDDSMKDSKQTINFILKDDSECKFKFEGEKLFKVGNIHYTISDYEDLFDFIHTLEFTVKE